MDTKSMFVQMAETGHAPREGCHLFSVGCDEAIQRLKTHYLFDRFDAGGSSEKLIIGPFGSGKTHFMRHFMEVARESGCVTSEVPLNRDRNIDFGQPHLVYREIVDELQVPGQEKRGLEALLLGSLDRVREKARRAGLPEGDTLHGWIAGLDSGFKLQHYGKVLHLALDAILRDDAALQDAACRWLSGDMFDRQLAKQLRTPFFTSKEASRNGRLAFLSLLQFIKRADFRGTVVGFDEAEQSFDVDRARLVRIHSVLQSFINALSDLEDGSALIMFALTPAAVENMKDFQALQQRIDDPGAGQGFFDGNVWAVKIDVTSDGRDPEAQLRAMGERLVDVFCDRLPGVASDMKVTGHGEAARVAREVALESAGSGARREVAKRVSAWLLVRHGALSSPARSTPEPEF